MLRFWLVTGAVGGCYREFDPPVPEAPVPSCPDAEPPEMDPEGTTELAADLGILETEPVLFCGAVGNGFDDGWLFSLRGPSVVTLETPYCECEKSGPHFEVIPIDPAPQVTGAGTLFSDQSIDALPDLPLGPGTWMLRMFDPGGVELDYVAELSAQPAAGRWLRNDAPADLLGAPLVGGQLSGWTAFPFDEADVLLVQITEEEATLRFSELTGSFLTLSLVTDENNDGLDNQDPLQQDRIDASGQAVTYDVGPGFYWLVIFGGPAVYTIDFESGFGLGAPF